MAGLGLINRRRAIASSPTKSDVIQFKDALVKEILIAQGVSSDGENISYEDAASVREIGITWFRERPITEFNEFQFFTSVTKIPMTAFRGCTSLCEITFPESVETIEGNAFLNCTSLYKADIANTRTLDRAFRNCPLLDVDLSKTVYWLSPTSGEGIVRESGITRVNAPLLQDMSSSQYASHFWGCTKLTEVLDLGDIAIIPDGNLNYSVFRGCTSLGKAILPPSLTHLGAYTFNQCKGLQVLISEATTPPTCGTTPFANTNSTFVIYVPDASVDAYKETAGWSSFAARIKGISEYNG